MKLSDREKNVLLLMRNDRVASIRRKRSWRPSEQAVAIAEVERLTAKLVEDKEETTNAEPASV